MVLLPGEHFEGEYIGKKIYEINDKLIVANILLVVLIVVEFFR